MSLRVLFFLIAWLSLTLKAQFAEIEASSNLPIGDLLRRANSELNPLIDGEDILMSEADYVVIGDTFFLNPHGTHYLFAYTKSWNEFRRLDRSIFHGHNFGRNLFTYKGEIYAFGGYGFWHSHSKLIKFNRKNREWDLMKIKGEVPDIFSSIGVLMGDSFMVYGIRNVDGFQVLNDTKSRLYFINMKTLNSVAYNHKINTEVVIQKNVINSQFSRYAIVAQSGMIDRIVDKQNGKIYKNYSGPNLFGEEEFRYRSGKDSNYIFSVGDELITYSRSGEVNRFNIQEFLKLYFNEEAEIGQILPLESGKRWGLNIEYLLYFIIVFLLIFIVYFMFLYYRGTGLINRRTLNDYTSLVDQKFDFSSIRTLSNGDYTEQEIDMAMQIFHLRPLVRNLKRSQMLFELNEMYPGYVIKIPHPKKKDQFKYRVSRSYS
ncbi:MAG: hypothetical protein NBV77_06925 [Bacteroidia bacterium]|nr:hypothetical protein [Bacteroidia bacterium]